MHRAQRTQRSRLPSPRRVPCAHPVCLLAITAYTPLEPGRYVDAYLPFVREIGDMVAARGATLLLIGDLPRLLLDGRECIHPDDFANCATPRARAWRLGWPVHPVDHCTASRIEAVSHAPWAPCGALSLSGRHVFDARVGTDTVQYAWALRNDTERRMTELAAQSASTEYISSEWFFDYLCDPQTAI